MTIVPGSPVTEAVEAGYNLVEQREATRMRPGEAPSSGAQVQKPPRRTASAAYRFPLFKNILVNVFFKVRTKLSINPNA